MKKIFILLSLILLLFTSCNLNIEVWGGDGELIVDGVTLETGSHKEIGKYRVHCVAINGYQKTSGDMLADYITFNTDSLYSVGDTIYIGK